MKPSSLSTSCTMQWWTLPLLLATSTVYIAWLRDKRSWSPRAEFDFVFRQAERQLYLLEKQRTYSYDATVAAYKARRGRDPPAGFDRWYELAAQTGAVLIETFWDLIYDDLEPFRAIPPDILRSQASALVQNAQRPIYGFSFREGRLVTSTCEDDNEPCLDLAEMLRSVAPYMAGDLDSPVNLHSSPRLIVPWDVVERLKLHTRNNEYANSSYQGFAFRPEEQGAAHSNQGFTWSSKCEQLLHSRVFQRYAVSLICPRVKQDMMPAALVPAACPPASAIHTSQSNLAAWEEANTFEQGLVKDGRLARNVCQEPCIVHP